MVRKPSDRCRRTLLVSLYQIIDNLHLTAVELKELGKFIDLQASHAEDAESD